MADTQRTGTLRRGALRVDILKVTDSEGCSWYKATSPKIPYKSNGKWKEARSFDRSQIATAVQLMQEADKKLAELEETVWEEHREGSTVQSVVAESAIGGEPQEPANQDTD